MKLITLKKRKKKKEKESCKGIYVETLDLLLDKKQFGCCNINNLIYLIVVESRNLKANDGFV